MKLREKKGDGKVLKLDFSFKDIDTHKQGFFSQ